MNTYSIFYCLLFCCLNISDTEYSNKWILTTALSYTDVKDMVTPLGFKLLYELPREQFVIVRNDTPRASKHKDTFYTKRLQSHPNVKSIKQEVWRKVNLRQSYNVNDALWNQMWYLNEQTNQSMGVLSAWSSRITGKGVNIAIIDEGVDYSHEDLKDRYEPSMSEDVYEDDKDPSPAVGKNHGTKCAGVALATENNICIHGVAHFAQLIALRVIGPMGVLPSGQIKAFSNQHVHVSSNSWGGMDNEFDGPTAAESQALADGVTKLRGGKGVIYVFAGGNGGSEDNCNMDGYVNSIYTIGINGVSRDHEPPGYAEPCSAILASAYTGKSETVDTVCATDLNNGCINSFSGTSAAAPLAAGIIALLLEHNPTLHWRDVQELVVTTSKSETLIYGDFKENGVGRKVSDWYGYGLLDASKLLQKAANWASLPPQHKCMTPYITVNKRVLPQALERTIESFYTTDGCNDTKDCVNRIEHVQIRVIFTSSVRGAVSLTLQSPMGATSNLLTARNSDKKTNSKLDWHYMSVQHWGEQSFGQWKLAMSLDTAYSEQATLEGWQLILYGTGSGCSRNETISDAHATSEYFTKHVGSSTGFTTANTETPTQASTTHNMTNSKTETICFQVNGSSSVCIAVIVLVLIVVVVALIIIAYCVWKFIKKKRAKIEDAKGNSKNDNTATKTTKETILH